MTFLTSLNDIKNIFYINLEHRKDRKEHVESQLKSVGITQFERFNAIKNEIGMIGCGMSHLQCLKIAKERNYDHILIVEDDITFLNPTLFINQINQFFINHKDWDVVLISGSNYLPYTHIDSTCIKVNNCQTTTGYIIKNNYFDTLIENLKQGIQLLVNYPYKLNLFSLDQYWKILQKKDNWYLIIPMSVVQREDYSDIERRNVNYTNEMLKLNK